MPFFPGSGSPVPPRSCQECRQADKAEIRICDVVVSMTRNSNLCVPAEFSAFIPRAEIRRRFQDGHLSEEEIILSSITIVHSPRHRAGEEGGGVTPAGPDQVIATTYRIPEPADPAPGPSRQWGDEGTWSGVKVPALGKGVPRVHINGRK